MIPTFMIDLEASITARARHFDHDLTAVFIAPSHEEVFCRVAARHFGMGVVWDPTILPELPGWDGSRPKQKRKPRQAAHRADGRATDAVASALATLGLAPGVSLAEARKVYRKGCLTRHPDRGGSTEAMSAWNAAWEVAREALS